MFVLLHKTSVEAYFFPCLIKEKLRGDTPRGIMKTGRVSNFTKFILNVAGVYAVNTKSANAGEKAIQITQSVLENKGSYSYFAEGTRSEDGNVGKFGVAGFYAAILAAEKTKVSLVCVDITSQYVDDVLNERKNHIGLREIIQSFNKNYGNTYISFSEPIDVLPLDKIGLTDKEITKAYRTQRMELAEKTRDTCIDLKVILNEHIHAEAICRLNPPKGSRIHPYEEMDSIAEVIADLKPYEHKFRGVCADNPGKVITRSILPTDSNLMNVYSVYSNYIATFLPAK
jgi:1-acyl-sn-glycerol-3-phosphate acyltransferase